MTSRTEQTLLRRQRTESTNHRSNKKQKQRQQNEELAQSIRLQIDCLKQEKQTSLERIQKFTSRPAMFPLLANRRRELEAETIQTFDVQLVRLEKRLQELQEGICLVGCPATRGDDSAMKEDERKKGRLCHDLLSSALSAANENEYGTTRDASSSCSNSDNEKTKVGNSDKFIKDSSRDDHNNDDDNNCNYEDDCDDGEDGTSSENDIAELKTNIMFLQCEDATPLESETFPVGRCLNSLLVGNSNELLGVDHDSINRKLDVDMDIGHERVQAEVPTENNDDVDNSNEEDENDDCGDDLEEEVDEESDQDPLDVLEQGEFLLQAEEELSNSYVESCTCDKNSSSGVLMIDTEVETEDPRALDWGGNEISILEVAEVSEGSANMDFNDTANSRRSGNEDDYIDLEEEKEDMDDNEDDLDLENYDGNTAEIEKIKNSKLSMAIQGFQSKAVFIQEQDDSEGKVNYLRTSSSSFCDDPPSIDYLGKVYYKNHCYDVKTGSKPHDYATVGILKFLPAQNNMLFVKCILVVPFEDTILGMEEDDVKFVADYRPSSHVQVYNQIACFPITDIVRESQSIDRVPSLIYEPQVPGNWQFFGYFHVKNQVRRIGRRNEMRMLDLFIGAGGMSLGYKNAGFHRVAAVEKDSCAIETLRKNHIGSYVYNGCVREFLRGFDDPFHRNLLGPIDHIHVSAPCQGFSGKNRKGGKNDEMNNELSMSIVDAVRIFKCTTAVFENVPGMWRRKHIHYIKNIVKELMKLGYQVRCATLKACDYGDPQKRPRSFMFVSKDSAPPPIVPTRTHGDDPHLLPYVTIKDALSTLSNVDRNTVHNYEYKKTLVQPGKHGVVRLDPCGLAPTICASSIPPYHPEEDRCISVREAATLQSFPVDYIFCGDLRDQYRQVGNAVPVELASAVAHSIRLILSYKYDES